MLGYAASQGLVIYSIILIFIDLLAITMVADALGWFTRQSTNTSTVKSAVETELLDPEFVTTQPTTSEEFRTIAQEHLETPETEEPSLEPEIIFADLKPVGPNESELRVFDEIIKEQKISKRTLVISSFHRKNYPSTTLITYLAKQAELSDILCHEISPGIDLIPYAGHFRSELIFPAVLFLKSQIPKYQRIVLLMPPEQKDTWKLIVSEAIPEYARQIGLDHAALTI
jgi:hypothetical protein